LSTASSKRRIRSIRSNIVHAISFGRAAGIGVRAPAV
jgi:hypothetical protein